MMGNVILGVGFLVFTNIYLLGLIFVLLSKRRLETDEKEKNELSQRLHNMIIAAIVMIMSVFSACFSLYSGAEGEISFQRQQIITITYKHVMIYISVIVEAVFIFIPISWLWGMFKLEEYSVARKNLLTQLNFIIFLAFVYFVVVIVISHLFIL
ncbi:MAG: hypothetical protein LBJ00_09415 [Planctomycetaceae bacterium]|jgi:hypothetical protein|nr:hypothetical protein [Planctomycetaceae bacterium]